MTNRELHSAIITTPPHLITKNIQAAVWYFFDKEKQLRIDPKATAVDLSRAAKQWQSIGEAKTAAGRNPEDRNHLRRLSSFLDAVGPFRKSETLWLETAKLLREAGSANERSAVVGDQQARACGRQIEFCSESFHELVLELTHNQEEMANLTQIRVAAYEFERHADSRPIEWLINACLEDSVLRRQASWGDSLDLWWLSTLDD